MPLVSSDSNWGKIREKLMSELKRHEDPRALGLTVAVHVDKQPQPKSSR